VGFAAISLGIYQEKKMKKTIEKIKDFVKPTTMKYPKRRKEECEIAGEETSEVAKEFLETLK
jgi:hypothetical protein